MRQYQPIWDRLKSLPPDKAATTGVSVTANRRFHARILKAVVKEKWLDIGFKLQLEDKRATLTHSSKNAILTFYLTYTLGKEDF